MPESATKRYLPYEDGSGSDVSVADYYKIPNRFLAHLLAKKASLRDPIEGLATVR